MVGSRVSMLTLICFFALISPMGFAKSVELKTIPVNLVTNYGVLRTEIHFDERDLSVALKVKNIVEKDLVKVINYFQHVPANTVHINVDPYTRLTNGNARAFPTNIINLYNYPPNNSEHLIILEDWLRGLVFHEYIHITHLDQTRDYLDVGRKIFGSFAKIPAGIVPRWFTEGIAVWGESHLINGGRLNNPLFRKELLVQFLRLDYCRSVDCLDEPGVYPGGSLSYWAGAHFLEYVETKKPGTVKCLVEVNSSKLPFMLNRVFENCTGSSAETLFEEFRMSLINNQPAIDLFNEAWGVKISNAFGSDDLQKGVVLEGNALFKVEQDRKREALVSYDLQENVNMVIGTYNFPISDVVGLTSAVDKEEGAEAKYLIVSFNEDLNFRKDNRVWKLVNSDTLLIENVLPFKHDPSYVIGLGSNRYLTASFIDNQWIIERQTVEFGAKSVSSVDVLQNCSQDINVTYFKKQGQKVFIKLNRGDLGTTLYMSDLSLEKFYKLYESKEYFDLPVLFDNFLVIREKENFKLVEFGEDFKKITVSEIDKKTFNRVTSVEVNNERVLVLENHLKTKEMPIKETIAVLKKDIIKSQAVSLEESIFTNDSVSSSFSSSNVSLESFPKIRHMEPHYWFLATGSSENLGSIGAMTTFSDPMDLNVLEATALSYSDANKYGGHLNYTHKFSSVDDLWGSNVYLNREYSKTKFSERINETTEGTLSTFYTVLLKRWTLWPALFVSRTNVDDFISKRSITGYGVAGGARYQAYSFDDFFQNLTLQFKAQNNAASDASEFFSMQGKLKTEARLYERLVGGLKTSYGKMFKSNFIGGALYGGGTNSTEQRWHEFYGFPYSNAYGNEIFTLRLYLDWNFWYIYRGSGFVPIFFKEAHLLLGREMMAADRIILDDVIYREKTINSFFFGPRIKTNLFYYVPADIDTIFSYIKSPNGKTINTLEFNVNVELF